MKKMNTSLLGQIWLAILLFITAAPVMAQTALYKAPFGVQTYTYRRSIDKDPGKVLDTIRRLGITEIESGGSRAVTLQEFKKMCDQRGIRIPSTGAGFEELGNNIDSVISKATVLGASFVMCSWIPHGKTFTLADAQKAVDIFNRAGKTLAEKGLTLCYHAHGYEFQPYRTGTLLDYLVEHTNPEYVSFEMDIMWVYFGGGDPVGLLEKYGSRWKLMHIKDLKKGTPKDLTGGTSTENDVAAGTGELNIPAILKAAEKAGIRHYFIEDESSRITEQVPQTIAYVKSLKE